MITLSDSANDLKPYLIKSKIFNVNKVINLYDPVLSHMVEFFKKKLKIVTIF